MIDFSDTVKIAKTMEHLEEWEAAAVAWNQAKIKTGNDYSFQIKACKLLAEASKMEKELPKRRPDMLIRFDGKRTLIEGKS